MPLRLPVFFLITFATLTSTLPLAIAESEKPEIAVYHVTDPRCELAVDPTGVDIAAPRLFWKLAATARGARQSSYQILVASSGGLLANDQGDLWDSGKIDSDETTYIRYAGKPLASSQQVYWKVRSWQAGGAPSLWSASANWTMGILSPADWKAEWISSAGPAQSLLLRRGFNVRPGLRRALVHVSALGQYEMTLNGGKAGDAFFTPGWSDYKKTILYDTCDVTPQLHEGPNAVGVLLGNGIYNVVRQPGRFAKFEGSHGPLRAILQLRLEYADGTTEFVSTDASWRAHTGPIGFNSIYGGEDYDARRLPSGWDQPGFDDKDWTAAVVFAKADESLRGISATAEPVRAIETRQPVNVKNFDDGTIVYDFGQNTSFMPRVKVTGPAGSTIRLTPSEIVNPDGTIARSTMGGQSRGASWWQYTKATDQEETYFPRFYYIGSRYVRAELVAPGHEPTPPPGFKTDAGSNANAEKFDAALLPHIVSIEDVIIHSSAEPAGEFAASNPLLDRIRMLVKWAQASNLMSLITDCPHRERLGWLEQQHLAGPSLRYEFAMSRLFAKSEHDMADAQDESGLVPNIAPEYTTFKGTFRAAAEWGASYILVPWQQYQFDGDIDLLRDHYDGMKRYFAYLQSQAKNDVLSEGLGDWFDLGPAKPNKAQLTLPPVTASAFLFYDAKHLSYIAEVLGKEVDAKDYAARAERIRQNYNRNFFHADTGTYATNSQGANAIALAMGIVDPADRVRVLDALVKDVSAHGNAMTTGDICFRYLLQALADGGESELIYEMINQDTRPGYAFQLRQGETALTESWNANKTTSHNHFMLGHITEWFYKDLAGIDVDPENPGFKNIIIRPNPVGDLTWVRASYNSIRGPIMVRWDLSGEHFKLTTRIPANATATIFLPAKEGAEITEGTTPAANATGIKFLRREADRAVYRVESGSYVFQSTW